MKKMCKSSAASRAGWVSMRAFVFGLVCLSLTGTAGARQGTDAKASRELYEQVAGQRVRVPPHAEVAFEYERDGDEEELEIELKWTRR